MRGSFKRPCRRPERDEKHVVAYLTSTNRSVGRASSTTILWPRTGFTVDPGFVFPNWRFWSLTPIGGGAAEDLDPPYKARPFFAKPQNLVLTHSREEERIGKFLHKKQILSPSCSWSSHFEQGDNNCSDLVLEHPPRFSA